MRKRRKKTKKVMIRKMKKIEKRVDEEGKGKEENEEDKKEKEKTGIWRNEEQEIKNMTIRQKDDKEEMQNEREA